MGVNGQEFEKARLSLNLSREAVASALGAAQESVLKAEQGTKTDSAFLDKLRVFYLDRGVCLPDPAAPDKQDFSIIDEVERMGDEIEDRPGPRSDPAY